METRGIRKYSRIECKTPICTQISIVKFNNKIVTTGKGNICVENISSGGLKFLSSLNLPVSDIMIIEFKLILEVECTAFYGYIVRREEVDGGIYRYGVKFINKAGDDDHEQFMIRLNELNKNGTLENSDKCSYDVDCIRKCTVNVDRRTYKRYKFNNNFVAKMKVHKISNKSGISQWVTIRIDNISHDGIQFITNINLVIDEDTMLEFSIVIANTKIYAKGYMSWREKVEENKYIYGVKLDITDSEKEKIVQVLAHVVDFSSEKGLLTHECFGQKFNYARPKNHNFERLI
ncbi:PilZ domain-containing protein [Clostridium estertheticum]|uniref:PilZ domain-containing protein n=1 Tax=Clostridium estertheticum TaxID=238834 RepID=UPI001C7D204B|nr:PilZ domain-containing protein [Clostridium estertheticum]MBX4260307.1 PilZ domain-containing protein [Clostridium estertheticum]WLC70996.1 PilZ domain-containing protein [Clostridium estertheticum]